MPTFAGMRDEEHRTLIRNTGTCLPNNTAQHPKRQTFSSIIIKN